MIYNLTVDVRCKLHDGSVQDVDGIKISVSADSLKDARAQLKDILFDELDGEGHLDAPLDHFDVMRISY